MKKSSADKLIPYILLMGVVVFFLGTKQLKESK